MQHFSATMQSRDDPRTARQATVSVNGRIDQYEKRVRESNTRGGLASYAALKTEGQLDVYEGCPLWVYVKRSAPGQRPVVFASFNGLKFDPQAVNPMQVAMDLEIRPLGVAAHAYAYGDPDVDTGAMTVAVAGRAQVTCVMPVGATIGDDMLALCPPLHTDDVAAGVADRNMATLLAEDLYNGQPNGGKFKLPKTGALLTQLVPLRRVSITRMAQSLSHVTLSLPMAQGGAGGVPLGATAAVNGASPVQAALEAQGHQAVATAQQRTALLMRDGIAGVIALALSVLHADGHIQIQAGPGVAPAANLDAALSRIGLLLGYDAAAAADAAFVGSMDAAITGAMTMTMQSAGGLAAALSGAPAAVPAAERQRTRAAVKLAGHGLTNLLDASAITEQEVRQFVLGRALHSAQPWSTELTMNMHGRG